jgi:hypothetical protein
MQWVRWADLSVQFQADRFAVYIEGVHFPPGPVAFDFATTQGLSPGDSIGRLHHLYPATGSVRTPSPNPAHPATQTFSISGKGGVISGVIEHESGGTVTSIFAGQFC